LLTQLSRPQLRRVPDELIGSDSRDPLIRRWYLFPKNRWFGVYLHHIMRSDEDCALHDHPKPNVSIVLKGSYREWMFYPDARRRGWRSWHAGRLSESPQGDLLACLVRRRFRIIFRPAALAHRIELIDGKPCWSLFITGPKVREWGFHCKPRWIPHYEFADRDGCD
jgi:hypothetical protein